MTICYVHCLDKFPRTYNYKQELQGLSAFLSADLNVRVAKCPEIVQISCLIEHKQRPHTKTL